MNNNITPYQSLYNSSFTSANLANSGFGSNLLPYQPAFSIVCPVISPNYSFTTSKNSLNKNSLNFNLLLLNNASNGKRVASHLSELLDKKQYGEFDIALINIMNLFIDNIEYLQKTPSNQLKSIELKQRLEQIITTETGLSNILSHVNLNPDMVRELILILKKISELKVVYEKVLETNI